MQTKGNTLKNIGIALAIFIAIGVAGYMYSTREIVPEESLSSQPSVEVQAVDGALLKALNTIEKIKLDQSVFVGPVIVTLVDFSQILKQQPLNRPNPFAPIEVDTPSTPTPTPTPTATGGR